MGRKPKAKKVETQKAAFYIKRKHLKNYEKFKKYLAKNKINRSEMICSLISNFVEELE
ncbi:MAG: hypothetical protein ACRCUM_03520 [Mycoplasmoidaceae bacterium]